jgi:hypothetical protein
MVTWLQRAAVIGVLIFPIAAAAQQPPAPAPQPPQPPPQAQPQPQPPPQPQQSGEWAKLPRMQLERQFAGPLQDTIVQRWRDPADNTICYLYLPITAAHTGPTVTGFVQYGANTIGSISCFEVPRTPEPARRPASGAR